jgi:hypothetical protein
MKNCNYYDNSRSLINTIPQVAGMPYSLYLSLHGNYFLGSSDELQFGNGESAWVGLFNPINSHINLHVYFWEVANTGSSPIRAQIWFNSNPSGSPTSIATVTPGNTALCPLPRPRIDLLQASNVVLEPTGGTKAFVRRAQPEVTIGDEEFGKFIFPPCGSFVIFLSNPETPDQPASATISFEWWEEKVSYSKYK